MDKIKIGTVVRFLSGIFDKQVINGTIRGSWWIFYRIEYGVTWDSRYTEIRVRWFPKWRIVEVYN